MEELAKNLKDIAKIRREIKGLELMIHSNRKTMATDVVSGSSDEFPYSVRHFRNLRAWISRGKAYYR